MKLLAFLGLLLFCMPGYAEQIAVATDGGDAIELHDRVHGKCAAGVTEARYIYDARKRLPSVDGCWKYMAGRDAIFVVFEDGDAFLIPLKKFTWKAGKQPATL